MRLSEAHPWLSSALPSLEKLISKTLRLLNLDFLFEMDALIVLDVSYADFITQLRIAR